MEPRFKTLAVALVPQPREVPLPPFPSESLQALFAEVGKSFPYRAFEYVFDGRGAKFSNGEADFAEVRPALFQIVSTMDGQDVLTADMATSKAVRVLELAADTLGVPGFLQCAVQVEAVVPLTEADADLDAKDFLAKRIMGGINVAALGDGFFGATVTFRRLIENPPGHDQLDVEPFYGDPDFVFVRYQATRTEGGQLLGGFDRVERNIGEAFSFLEGETMQLLDGGGG